MQIIIREIDATLKIDTVSTGGTSGAIVPTPFGSSTANSIASWSGTVGSALRSNNTVTLTGTDLIAPSTVTVQFLGAGATSTRIGPSSLAAGTSSVSIGNGSSCVSTNGVAVGRNALVNSPDSGGVSIGNGATITLLGPSLAIGASSIAADRGVALGPACVALNTGLAIGGAAHAENSSIAIGSSATTSTFTTSVALGSSSTATGSNQFQVGASGTPLAIHAYSGFGVFGHTPPLAQPAAIPDASGGATIDAEARAAINALLAAVRGTGIINT